MPSLHLIPKVLVFCLFIATCSAPAYLGLVYKDILRLLPSQIGIVQCIPSFVAIIVGPLLTFLADYTKQPRTMLAGSLLLTTGVLWIFVTQPLGFVGACGVAALYAVVNTPTGSLMDVLILEMLGDDKDLYGQQRLWGSVAAGITSFSVGVLVEKTKSIVSSFYVHSAAAANFAFLLFAITMYQKYTKKPEPSKTELPSALKKTVSTKSAAVVDEADKTLQNLQVPNQPTLQILHQPTTISFADSALRSRRGSRPMPIKRKSTVILAPNDPPYKWLMVPDVWAFYFACTVLGAVFTGIGNFLWIFMSDDLKAGAILRGMTGPVEVVLQLPFFFFAKPLLAKFGVRKIIIAVHVMMIVRCIGYTFLTPETQWIILAPHALHGAAFSGLWTAAVSFSTQIAPKGMQFMAQGILGAFYGSLGGGIGGIATGIIYNKFGAVWLFRGLAGATLISMIVYIAVPGRGGPLPQRGPSRAGSRRASRQTSRQVSRQTSAISALPKIISTSVSRAVSFAPTTMSNVPVTERVLDKQGSQKLLDAEEAITSPEMWQGLDMDAVEDVEEDYEMEEEELEDQVEHMPANMSHRTSVAAIKAFQSLGRMSTMNF